MRGEDKRSYQQDNGLLMGLPGKENYLRRKKKGGDNRHRKPYDKDLQFLNLAKT